MSKRNESSLEDYRVLKNDFYKPDWELTELIKKTIFLLGERHIKDLANKKSNIKMMTEVGLKWKKKKKYTK